MAKNKLISVVVPFVDHAGYIQRVAQSLFEQTYSNWELLFIDNGSTDESREKIMEYCKNDSRILCFEEEQRGIPFARNRGLHEAKGEYISFLDVDDKFAPDKLTRLSLVLDQELEVAMAYGLTKRVYLPEERILIQDFGMAREGLNEPPILAMDWIQNFYHLPQTGATLIRTEIAKEIGGFEEGLLLGNDDVAFHLKIAFNFKIWFDVHEAVIYYRHSQSEGAKLNRELNVTKRYLDVHENWIMSYVLEYEKKTGDRMPRYWAEKAVLGNLFEYAHKQFDQNPSQRKRFLQDERNSFKKKGFLKTKAFSPLFNIHEQFSKKTAKFLSKIYNRFLSLISSQQYPLKIPH